MTAAVICLTLVGLAALAACWLLQRSHQEAQAQWFLERRELLTRIQAPQYVPLGDATSFEVPDAEPDESNLVGTVAEPDDEQE